MEYELILIFGISMVICFVAIYKNGIRILA